MYNSLTEFERIVTAQETNAFVAVGGDVRLNCSTTNLIMPVKWYRTLFSSTSYSDSDHSEYLYNSRSKKTTNERMSVTTVHSGNEQHLNLIITRTNSSDAGSYYCVQNFRSLALHRLVVVG